MHGGRAAGSEPPSLPSRQLLTSLAFVALHAEQSWGNWGGLLAIAGSGLAFTALRALSGSVLVPMLAHLLYNAALSLPSA